MLSHVLLLEPPGGFEWLLIFGAFVLLFGGKKIPELMKNIGKGIHDFNEAKGKDKEKEAAAAPAAEKKEVKEIEK